MCQRGTSARFQTGNALGKRVATLQTRVTGPAPAPSPPLHLKAALLWRGRSANIATTPVTETETVAHKPVGLAPAGICCWCDGWLWAIMEQIHFQLCVDFVSFDLKIQPPPTQGLRTVAYLYIN